MTNTKLTDFSCLICSSNISTIKPSQVDKLDILFLMRILLEIPEESQLVENIKDLLNPIQICNQCASEIKECKEIYSEICNKIERFWEYQNKILEKFSKQVKRSRTKKDNDDTWVVQCRKFVNDHDFTGFGYPFTVHDLETLLISVPSPSPPQHLKDKVNNAVKNELPTTAQENDNDSLHISEDPFEEVPSPFTQPSEHEDLHVKQEPESEEEATAIQDEEEYKFDEDDNLSSDNDSDYQPSPSKKPRTSPTKRNPTRKSTKQVNRQDTQIKKRSNRKISDSYPIFNRDPTTKKYHCTWSADCGRQFTVKEYILFHWDRHKGIPRQQCEECPQAFYSRRELVCHRQAEHPKEGDKFDCEICGKGYRSREALLGHKRSYHDDKKEEERKAKMKKKEEDPIKKDPVSKKWMCYWPDCDKKYLERSDLNFHLDRHKGTPQQKCGECGQLFYSRCQLVEHKEKEHEKDKKFDCNICGDKFDTSGKLYNHKTFKHSEKGTGVQVVCQICGKSYKKACLYSHMRFVHGSVEERKFVCHLCPRSFVDLTGLKRHLWRVHQICESEKDKEKFLRQREREKEKGYKWTCHVKGCRVKYVTEEGLKKHVDGVHKGKWDEVEDTDWKLKCEICGKGFHVKQKLMRHVKQHEKEKCTK